MALPFPAHPAGGPPAAGAAPPGGDLLGPGAPPAVAPLPRCYRELLLSDEANSLSQDCLANYMQGYRFDGGPTPAALRDQTVHMSDRQPMAFLCLVTGAGGLTKSVFFTDFCVIWIP